MYGYIWKLLSGCCVAISGKICLTEKIHLLFTFYIINQISIIIKHLTVLVFLRITIKSYLTGGLVTARRRNSRLKVMTIHNQHHANVSKQRTLLAEVDLTTSKGVA